MGWKPERIVPIPHKDLLSWMFDSVRYDEDRPEIYIEAKNENNRITNKEARMLIRRLVAGLHAAGLAKGDCVCVHSRNSVRTQHHLPFQESLELIYTQILYPILFLAIVGAGGVFTGTNPASTPQELKHYIQCSKAKFFPVESIVSSTLAPVLQDLGVDSRRIFPTDEDMSTWTGSALLQHRESDWVHFDDEQTSKDTEAARLFSSGTTGPPKAASISHYNIVAQHVLTHGVERKNFETRHLVCLPMFHTGTIFITHTSALKLGIPSFVMPQYELQQWLYFMEKYQISEIMPLPPPIVVAVINSPLSLEFSLASVRNVRCGAAPLEKEPLLRFKALLHPNAIATQIWGMTESTFVATKFDYPDNDDEGSVGCPIANLEMKIINDEGQDITEVNIKGEICLKGPTIIRGYVQADFNKTVFDEDGYLKTGDIRYRNEKGKVFILDRKKVTKSTQPGMQILIRVEELIKVETFQVAPAELEAVLLDHPDIADCAVIGVSLPERGYEGPRAYVVRQLRENHDFGEEGVKAHIASRLASYKQLTGGVVFVDSIPKTGSGKILKRVLREQALREMGAAV